MPVHLVLPHHHHSFFYYISNCSAVSHTEPMLLLLQSTSIINKELHFSVSEDVKLVLGLVFVFRNVKPFILVIKDFIYNLFCI